MFLIISKALAYLPCLMNILARLSLSIESSPLVSGSFTGSGLAGDGAGGAVHVSDVGQSGASAVSGVARPPDAVDNAVAGSVGDVGVAD